MLGKPRAGWATVTIGDWKGPVSYLCDPAEDLLEAAIKCLQTNLPQAVEIDGEETSAVVVFGMCETYVIYREEEEPCLPCLVVREDDIEAIVAELVNDVRTNITNWADWQRYETSEEKQAMQENLEKLCNTAEVLTRKGKEKA